jgi:hypothetical protein
LIFWRAECRSSQGLAFRLLPDDGYASMIADPYAPPAATLHDAAPTSPAFYVVSKSKFAMLFVATNGFYIAYWLYKNWKLHRAAGNKVLPLVRTIFGVFFIYSLFTRIDRRIKASGRDFRWFPRSLALAFIVVACTSSAAVWIQDFHIQFAMSLLVLLLQIFCLLSAQAAINYSENDSEGHTNSALTFANGVWIGLGLCFWTLLFLTYFLLP